MLHISSQGFFGDGPAPQLGSPIPSTAESRQKTLAVIGSDPYGIALWNACVAGKRKLFLAEREHEAFLAIKAGFDFPDPVAHIILSSLLGPTVSVNPADRVDAVKHGLQVLKAVASDN